MDEQALVTRMYERLDAEATAAHPMGLRRRRHLRLAGRRVTGVADEILDGSAPGPDDVVGDGPLAEALAAPRTGRMGDAVATLRAEQDAIVRSPHRGITVVQGGPGTGKTVVALHRAAYVLFAFPAAARRGVLVVGPDARFLRYISRVVAGLLAEPPAALRELRRAPGAAWTPADLALLDEAAALVDTVPDAYGHVVVDEAQELTEMDWRVVLRRCPSRSMTVVGDFAQAGRGSTVTGWREAVGTRFALHTLTVNYRTTAEILAYSREVLARIAPGRELGRSLRHGEPPRVASDLAAEVAAHADDLIAVICPDRLAAEIETLLVGGGTRAAVVPVGSCRGLEFDTVLVVAPAEIGENPRDLYVALTRATRRLILVEPPGTAPDRVSGPA